MGRGLQVHDGRKDDYRQQTGQLKLERPTSGAFRAVRRPSRVAEADTVRTMLRSILLLAAVMLSMVACGSLSGEPPGSYYKCDRNGDREQRVACMP